MEGLTLNAKLERFAISLRSSQRHWQKHRARMEAEGSTLGAVPRTSTPVEELEEFREEDGDDIGAIEAGTVMVVCKCKKCCRDRVAHRIVPRITIQACRRHLREYGTNFKGQRPWDVVGSATGATPVTVRQQAAALAADLWTPEQLEQRFPGRDGSVVVNNRGCKLPEGYVLRKLSSWRIH